MALIMLRRSVFARPQMALIMIMLEPFVIPRMMWFETTVDVSPTKLTPAIHATATVSAECESDRPPRCRLRFARRSSCRSRPPCITGGPPPGGSG